MMIEITQSQRSASPTSAALHTSGEEKIMIANLSNPIMGRSILSTEHAASSYGIPVLVDAEGNAYGPADIISPADELAWLHNSYGFTNGPITARMLVEKYGLAEWNSIEPVADMEMRIEMSRKFLGL